MAEYDVCEGCNLKVANGPIAASTWKAHAESAEREVARLQARVKAMGEVDPNFILTRLQMWAESRLVERNKELQTALEGAEQERDNARVCLSDQGGLMQMFPCQVCGEDWPWPGVLSTGMATCPRCLCRQRDAYKAQFRLRGKALKPFAEVYGRSSKTVKGGWRGMDSVVQSHRVVLLSEQSDGSFGYLPIKAFRQARTAIDIKPEAVREKEGKTL